MKNLSPKSCILLLGLLFCIAVFLGSLNNKNSSYIALDQNSGPTVSYPVRNCSNMMITKRCDSCNIAKAVYSRADCSEYTELIEDTKCSDLCPKCIQDEEVSRTCSGCDTASVTYKNKDCSESSKTISDTSCKSACPLPVVAPKQVTNGFACNCSKTCEQMTSCTEAYYQLNTCGCSKRDGDHDGVPCESICN